MNGTWISDAELKDILLTMAKSGAPKPKEGTVLGDALARFTTSPAGILTAGAGAETVAKVDLKTFAVFATVTKTQGIVIVIDAESVEEAIDFVGRYGEQVASEASDYYSVDTPSGMKNCRVGWDESVYMEVTINDAEDVTPDDSCGSEDGDDD